MKRLNLLILLAVAASVLVACGPAEVKPVYEVKPNETAFLVPMEAGTNSGQTKFMSLEYLKENKLAAKRVEIPVRKHSTGRMPWEYEWLETMKLIIVDRTPVTREWTASEGNGTSKKNEGFPVESADSIGFTLGATITTSVSEANSSLFLYRYAGQSLAKITDTNIRSFIQGKITNAFGKLSLTKCKAQKGTIYEEIFQQTKDQFSEYGVTVDFFGPNEGLVYDNPKIQASIDDAYAAEMLITQRQNEKVAQDEDNKRIRAAADTKLYEAHKFAAAQAAQTKMIGLEIEKINAEARLTFAKKWDGKLPEKILPSDSPLLMNVQ